MSWNSRLVVPTMMRSASCSAVDLIWRPLTKVPLVEPKSVRIQGAGLVLADFRVHARDVDVGDDDVVLRLAPDGLGLAGQREGAVVGDVIDVGLARLVVLVVVVFHVLVDGRGLVVVAAGGCGCWRRSGSGLLVAVARLRAAARAGPPPGRMP